MLKDHINKKTTLTENNKIFDSLFTDINLQLPLTPEIYTNGSSFSELINNYVNENTPSIINTNNSTNPTNPTNSTNSTNSNTNIESNRIHQNTNEEITVNNNNNIDDNNNNNNSIDDKNNINNNDDNNNNNNDYSEQLQKLNTMGFYDNNYNLQLLELFGGDLNLVINSYIN